MRNPFNTNQTLFLEPTYKGFAVQTHKGPLILNYLKRLHRVFGAALNQYSSLYVVRLDLHFSRCDDLPDDARTNVPIERFFSSLRAKLDWRDDSIRRAHGRVNRHGMRYAWAREMGPESQRPHYHVVLILNRSAFQRLGNYADPNVPGLYKMCLEAWASAIYQPRDLAKGLVSVVDGGQWHLNRVGQAPYREAFFASSYLCKARSKVYELGFHGFNCSRK
ncbi:MAG: inovirus Gp2 family protein [Pseudomonas sp.]|nr:inovirus Gp2 family protein [Pseudomonas sp.]